MDSVWNQGFLNAWTSPYLPSASISKTYFWMVTVAVPKSNIPGMQVTLVNLSTILESERFWITPYLLVPITYGIMNFKNVVLDSTINHLNHPGAQLLIVIYIAYFCVICSKFCRATSGFYYPRHFRNYVSTICLKCPGSTYGSAFWFCHRICGTMHEKGSFPFQTIITSSIHDPTIDSTNFHKTNKAKFALLPPAYTMEESKLSSESSWLELEISDRLVIPLLPVLI